MSRCVTAGPTFFLDPFALRQWEDPNYKGTRIEYDPETFLKEVHNLYENGSCPMKDGYAPFCKHLFVENFVNALTGCIPITEDNAKYLRSAYNKRRPEELAVLTRWFSKEDVEVPKAQFLDIILYSREQILKEVATLNDGERYPIPDVPWGIISIKAQMEDYETPMTPITIMRNALGTEFGGSGVPIQMESYNAAAEYWQSHALVM